MSNLRLQPRKIIPIRNAIKKIHFHSNILWDYSKVCEYYILGSRAKNSKQPSISGENQYFHYPSTNVKLVSNSMSQLKKYPPLKKTQNLL